MYHGENGGGGIVYGDGLYQKPYYRITGKKGSFRVPVKFDLGHSKNYIHNIVTGYSQPSVKELLYLIDTLGITPRLFFDEEAEYRNPILVQEIIDGIKSMNDQDLEAVLVMVRRLNEKN